MATQVLFSQADASGFANRASPFAELVKVVYEKPFLKTLDQDTWAFQLFPRKSTKDEYVRWKVRTTFNGSIEFYEELDALDAGVNATGGAAAGFTVDTWKNAEIPLKMARVNMAFSGLTEAATDAAWIDQRADVINHTLEDFRHGINDALIRFVTSASTVDARLPQTIAGVVSDGTSTCSAATNPRPGQDTYATWNRNGSDTFARSYVQAATTERPLTIALMQKQYATMTITPTRQADPGSMVIVTTPSIVDSYGDIADARRRWNVSGRSGKIDLGYSDFEYKGIPILSPPRWHTVKADVSTMYWLDKRSWNIYMLKPFETEELSKTTSAPDTITLVVKSYFNLVCKAPWQQGLICDLSSTY